MRQAYWVRCWFLLWDNKCCNIELPIFLQTSITIKLQSYIMCRSTKCLKASVLTSEPARTPQVSKFLFVFDLASFMKLSIIVVDWTTNGKSRKVGLVEDINMKRWRYHRININKRCHKNLQCATAEEIQKEQEHPLRGYLFYNLSHWPGEILHEPNPVLLQVQEEEMAVW